MLTGMPVTSPLAEEFTNQWKGELQTTKDMYADASESVDGLDAVQARLGQEYDTYMGRYGDLMEQLVGETGLDLANRRTLAAAFMQLATPDLDGAGNRAMAGVAHQSALARDQISREMTRGGGSPRSSNFAGTVRQNALDEAKNKVLAGTTARTQERQVGLNAAATGMQLFDPTRTAGLSLAIQQGANSLLTSEANTAATGAQLRTGIAGGYARDVTDPVATTAGVYQGMATAAPSGSGSGNRAVRGMTSVNWQSGTPSTFEADSAEFFAEKPSTLQYGTRADGSFGLL